MNCFSEEAFQGPVMYKEFWFSVWDRGEHFEVHKSIRLDHNSFTYQPVLDLVGVGAKPIIVGSYELPTIMGGTADIWCYVKPN